MSEDSFVGSILNSLSGNLATDLTKALARKTSNTRIVLAVRDRLGVGKEHSAALDIFSEVVSRTQSQVNISRGTLKKFLKPDANRELIFEFIISPLDESSIDSIDSDILLSAFDTQGVDAQQKSELRKFLPVLHKKIHTVRQSSFPPETQIILNSLQEIENSIQLNQIQLLNSVHHPPLSQSLLDSIEPSKKRAKEKNIAYKMPFLLIALLQDQYSAAKECFDECQEGLANRIIDTCEKWIRKQEAKQEAARDPFIEFQWRELESVRLAERFAQEENSPEVLKKHLLLGTLQMESSSIIKNFRESFLEGDFEKLLHLTESKPLPQWTKRKGTPDADMF